jgi:hypothetical protein
MTCWDVHLPLMNHRESWAEEKTAPTKEQWGKIQIEEQQPKKRPRKVKEETAASTDAASSGRVILRRSRSE